MQHSITFRVRYPEVDAMGVVHHSRYFQYFELGRVELLRANGFVYADLEKQGFLFVVVKVAANFKQPAKYDDEVTLTTKLTRHTHVRFDHAYELRRGDALICEGTSTVACVGRDGQLRTMPEGFEPRE